MSEFKLTADEQLEQALIYIDFLQESIEELTEQSKHERNKAIDEIKLLIVSDHIFNSNCISLLKELEALKS